MCWLSTISHFASNVCLRNVLNRKHSCGSQTNAYVTLRINLETTHSHLRSCPQVHEYISNFLRVWTCFTAINAVRGHWNKLTFWESPCRVQKHFWKH